MAFDEEGALRGLLKHRAAPGKLLWIGLRSGRHQPVQSVHEVQAVEERGLLGDHTSLRGSKKRQVSILQAEHLPVIAALSGHASVAPDLLRRNLLIAGINVLALRSARFRIGDVLFEGTGTCDPCSKMERALGHGGYNAMRGHGGVLARVVSGGVIRVSDPVDFAVDET